MAKAFTLGDWLKPEAGVSNSDTGQEQLRYISLDDIDPDPGNFYSLEGLDELAGNIELIGLQQPLRVRPNGERWTVVSGHRRRAACMMIRDGGNPMFDGGVPCLVDYGEASDAMRELSAEPTEGVGLTRSGCCRPISSMLAASSSSPSRL